MGSFFTELKFRNLSKMTLETVYAIHSFEAENDDEIPFQVGEPIIILEKDELYGDSWWKVRKP